MTEDCPAHIAETGQGRGRGRTRSLCLHPRQEPGKGRADHGLRRDGEVKGE